jgi:acyl dehydratase
MTMAMIVANMGPQADSAGLGAAGVDELRWLKPVYPGDVLRCETVIEEVRASISRPEMGSARSRMTVFNQDDAAVLSFVAIGLWRRRPA